MNDPNTYFSVAVLGDIGSGKTLFAKRLVKNLHMKAKNNKLPITS